MTFLEVFETKGDFMYVRPPNSARDRVRIPENYSGNAFTRDQRADMPPPVKISSAYDLPPDQIPHIRAEEKNGETATQEFSSEAMGSTERKEEVSNIQEEVKAPPTKQTGSIFESLIPPIRALEHSFPFGHGLGSEELLILGMMMLVYFSGNESGSFDYEFMILLGLLLFAG